MQRKSALLLAKTGYIIRDLLLGKFSAKLTESMDLVVAVPNPNDQNLNEWIKGKPIQLVTYETRRPVMLFGERYFSAQHWMYRIKQFERENPSLEIVTRLYEPNLGGKRKQFVRFMLFMGKTIKTLHLTGLSEEVFLFIVSQEPATRQWIKILRRIKPSVVISTMLTLPDGMYAYSTDLPIVLAARKLHIPCGTIVQSWDNLSSKAYVLPTWLDRYWTWSEAMSQDLKRFNSRIKNKERVRVVGSPHFDYHLESSLREPREIFMQKLSLDPKLPYALIGTGLEYLLPGEPFVIIDLVKQIQKDIPGLQILLRLHPKDMESRWPGHFEYLHAMGVIIQNTIPDIPMDQGGFTPPSVFFQEQINTIFHSTVVINTASSLTVDAAIIDRPVISLGYDLMTDKKFPEGRAGFYNRSEHFGALVKTGGVWVVRSQGECVDAIRHYLNNPELHASNRHALAQKVGGCFDGMAGVRLADEITSLISGD